MKNSDLVDLIANLEKNKGDDTSDSPRHPARVRHLRGRGHRLRLQQPRQDGAQDHDGRQAAPHQQALRPDEGVRGAGRLHRDPHLQPLLEGRRVQQDQGSLELGQFIKPGM